MYEIVDGDSIRIGNIIEESFHMSFPFIFTYEKKIYMLPETSANMDIRIYESIEFPMKWRLKKVLMQDIFAVDSMIFFYNKLWWLFTNINPDNGTDACSDLFIFFATSPFSDEWSPHEMNPVIVDSDKARNAGILTNEGNLFRVSQKQKFDMYGGEFNINKINTLNPKIYDESIDHIMTPALVRGAKAYHHLHSKGKITVFDFFK